MASCLRNAFVGLLVVLLSYCVSAGRDNQGDEFILGFMENKVFRNSKPNDVELFVTTASDKPVTVTVTTPLYDRRFWVQKTVVKGATTMFTIPHGIRGEGNEKSNKGVYVQATHEVTVYSVNKEEKSTDAYVSLPVDVLGTEYYAATYIQDPEVLVIGTEDNTVVNISCPVSDQVCAITLGEESYRNGSIFTVRLNKFETLHAIHESLTADYTGVHVTSSKPVSVVSGNRKVKVTDEKATKNSADHLTEQMMPVSTWGSQFIVSSTPLRYIGDFFRVVASRDKTSVKLHNGTTFLLKKAGHFIQFDIPSGEYQEIVSDAPTMMIMFSKTWENEDVDGPHRGDPSMSVIIPPPQFASDYTWSTVKEATGKEFVNTVLVIVDKTKVLGLRLDGKMVNWEEEKAIIGNPDKVHLWVKVAAGSHTLYHMDPSVTFMAMVSGVFLHNSYAYLAGLRLAEINTVCVPTSNTTMQIADIVDNDCDMKIDEELLDGIDNDGDGLIDEDVAKYPPTVYSCEITGDPHLKLFHGQRASIPFPCQYDVADLKFNDFNQSGLPTFDEREVEVSITASNGLTPVRGQYYVDVVSVIVSVNTPGGAQTPIGNFTTWSDKVHSAFMNTESTMAPEQAWHKEWDTDDAQLRDRIQFREDSELLLAELTISGLSLRVQFRPFNDKKLRPGIYVEVGGDVISDDRALFPATMCSTIHDVKSPLLRAWGVPVSTKDVGLFAAVKQTLTQTIGDGRKLCSSVIDLYKNCASDREFALGNCSKALSEPAVLKCAASEEDSNNQLRDDAGFDIFGACLDAFCVPDPLASACLRLQMYDENCPGLWPEIKGVICPTAA